MTTRSQTNNRTNEATEPTSVDTHERYRMALVLSFFANKAIDYLKEVERIPDTSDAATRAHYEARFERLGRAVRYVEGVITKMRNNPQVIAQKKAQERANAGYSHVYTHAAPVATHNGGYSGGTHTDDTSDMNTPMVNINGMPMVGATDIYGNAYGTTMNDPMQ